jgi:hypothetical protein
MRAAPVTMLLFAYACGGAPVHPAPARTAREVCVDVKRATRACEELYVPALLRTRARFDQPSGIRARYEAEGEDHLLPIAHEEFHRDFSEEGIASFCALLDDRPLEEQQTIAEREASCLPVADDCEAFVECNMRLLETRWSMPR